MGFLDPDFNRTPANWHSAAPNASHTPQTRRRPTHTGSGKRQAVHNVSELKRAGQFGETIAKSALRGQRVAQVEQYWQDQEAKAQAAANRPKNGGPAFKTRTPDIYGIKGDRSIRPMPAVDESNNQLGPGPAAPFQLPPTTAGPYSGRTPRSSEAPLNDLNARTAQYDAPFLVTPSGTASRSSNYTERLGADAVDTTSRNFPNNDIIDMEQGSDGVYHAAGSMPAHINSTQFPTTGSGYDAAGSQPAPEWGSQQWKQGFREDLKARDKMGPQPPPMGTVHEGKDSPSKGLNPNWRQRGLPAEPAPAAPQQEEPKPSKAKAEPKPKEEKPAKTRSPKAKKEPTDGSQ